MPITISERDRGRAVSTVTLAFALDPVIRWLYQDTADYLTYWPRFVEAYGGAEPVKPSETLGSRNY